MAESRESRTVLAPPPDSPSTPGEVPTFSVVIPAYQAADTIAEAIASALGQTTPPLEVIVCDDGSTDDIAAAVAPFGEEILFVQDENAGAAAARNRGLALAKGDFVAFLDTDDAWLPLYLERLGELGAMRPDLDLLSADVFYEADGEVLGRFYERTRFEIANQRHAVFRTCFVGWPAARRTRLAAVGGFDESLKIAHDWDAWARMILSGATAGLVTEPLIRYRFRPGSLTSDIPRSLRERVVFLDRLGAHPDVGPDDKVELENARRFAEGRALLAEAKESLATRQPDARRRALAVAGAEGLEWKRRLLGLGAAALPRVAGAMLSRRSTPSEPRRSRFDLNP
jgi:glycosyltransferase involved in cell wall biosynthesis